MANAAKVRADLHSGFYNALLNLIKINKATSFLILLIRLAHKFQTPFWFKNR
jgi:hypothetical protein